MDAEAEDLYDDAGADLDEARPESGELGTGERRGTGDGVARGKYEPVGSGVQDQPELVGERLWQEARSDTLQRLRASATVSRLPVTSA